MAHFEHVDKTKGFSSFAGVELLTIKDGYAEGRIVIEECHKNPLNTVHGGVMFTLADQVAGMACFSTGAVGPTMSSSIDFLQPAFDPKEIRATASPVKLGKNICIFDVTITDEKGDVKARASFKYFILEHRDVDVFKN
ncbi:MAG: PaaI family thioesterase [Lachnospiraceae bacterium]|nr:PaaI family thioesterase [Lachnospiraceae bacterium]